MTLKKTITLLFPVYFMWIFFLLNCSLKILKNKKNSTQKLVEEKTLSLETRKSVLNMAEKGGWQNKNNIFFNLVIHKKKYYYFIVN